MRAPGAAEDGREMGESSIQQTRAGGRMWLTAEQEHAITNLIGTRETASVRISPGLFDEDPVSLSLGTDEGPRTYLISRDGRAWEAESRGGTKCAP